MLHYLKAVRAARTIAGGAVAEGMPAIPIEDMFARDASPRRDGRMMHEMYSVEVKTPAEQRQPWDYYKVVDTAPGEQAFRPLAESSIPLVRA